MLVSLYCNPQENQFHLNIYKLWLAHNTAFVLQIQPNTPDDARWWCKTHQSHQSHQACLIGSMTKPPFERVCSEIVTSLVIPYCQNRSDQTLYPCISHNNDRDIIIREPVYGIDLKLFKTIHRFTWFTMSIYSITLVFILIR